MKTFALLLVACSALLAGCAGDAARSTDNRDNRDVHAPYYDSRLQFNRGETVRDDQLRELEQNPNDPGERK